jgi:hypothetical protein
VAWREALRAAGAAPAAPFKSAAHDPDRHRWGPRLALRRRIEPTLGQLVERFEGRRLRVQDLWHLEHRRVRKILSPTGAVALNVRAGHEPLQFDRLVA